MAAFTLVQSAEENTGDVTSAVVTLAAAPTVGNLLVFYLMVGGNITVTPPNGITRAQEAASTGNMLAGVYYAVVDATLATQTSFTFTLSATHTQALRVEEWQSASGWLSVPLNVTASAFDNSATTALDTGATAQTAQPSELWVMAVGYKAGAQTPTNTTSGWTTTPLSNGTANSAIFGYEIATASGSARWQGTLTTAEYTAGVVATFAAPTALSTMASSHFLVSGTITLHTSTHAAFRVNTPPMPLGAGAESQFLTRVKGLKVTLAGQDITAYVDELSLDIESNLGQGPGVPSGSSGRATTCRFLCYLGPQATALGSGQSIPQMGGPYLVRQGEVIIYDANGQRIFGGYASDFQDKTKYTVVKTQVTASDYWQNLARIGINQIFTSSTDTAIIQELMATYAADYDMSLFVSTPNYLFTKLFLRAKTMQEAMQKIADTTGFDIWVDAYKRLRYQSPSALGTAPFSVSDGPDFITSFPVAVTSYEKDDTAIINRVYFYGGKTPSDDFTQDLSPQVNGNNATLVLAYYPRESSDGHIDVYVNGVKQVAGYALGPGNANKLKSQGGLADVLINADAQALLFNVAPAVGATVTCTYRYESPMVVQVSNQASYTYFGRWFDGFISDQTVLDKQTAIQRARILLLEQAYGLQHLALTCYKPGLQAGQLLRVDHRVRGIHDAFIVQTVKTVPLGNGQFEYQAQLGGWNWNLVDILVQAGRQGMIIDQYTNESEDIVQAYDNPFGLGSGILVSTTNRSSGVYYARTTALGDGHDAYPGLFTITS